MSQTTFKHLARKYGNQSPAKVIQEAESPVMKSDKQAKNAVYAWHQERELNTDFYYDDLLRGES